jgi:hypothetical protein
MSHLLDRDVDDRPAPPFQGLAVCFGNARLAGTLEAERGVEIAAHQRVLDLRGLRQEVEELLARADHDLRLVGTGRLVVPHHAP